MVHGSYFVASGWCGRAAALVALILIPTLARTTLLAPPVFQSYSLLLSVSQIEPELLGEVLEIMMHEVRKRGWYMNSRKAT